MWLPMIPLLAVAAVAAAGWSDISAGSAPPAVAAVPPAGGETVSEKLDPSLLEIAQTAAVGREAVAASVQVMVALSAPPTADEQASLEAAGLEIRGITGDIVTGTVRPADLLRVAADPAVVKLEGSRPLEPEPSPEPSDDGPPAG